MFQACHCRQSTPAGQSHGLLCATPSFVQTQGDAHEGSISIVASYSHLQQFPFASRGSDSLPDTPYSVADGCEKPAL